MLILLWINSSDYFSFWLVHFVPLRNFRFLSWEVSRLTPYSFEIKTSNFSRSEPNSSRVNVLNLNDRNFVFLNDLRILHKIFSASVSWDLAVPDIFVPGLSQLQVSQANESQSQSQVLRFLSWVTNSVKSQSHCASL